MSREHYTDQQRDTYVQRAAQIGLGPAMKELGYPGTLTTASRWCQRRGVRPNLSSLQRYAATLGQFYTAKEKIALCQQVLDQAYDLLIHGEPDPEGEEITVVDPKGDLYYQLKRRPVTASTLSRISSVVQRTIATMELLEGRATDRVEQITSDTTDIELVQLISEYRAKNAETIQELRQ